MEITPSNIDAMFKGFNVRFNNFFKSASPFWPGVAMEMPSDAESETYAWMDKIPMLREWIGERVIANLSARSMTVVNKNYELTIEVDRNHIKDDRFGIFAPTLAQMGTQAKLHPDVLVAAAMQSGKTTLTYDGQNFFDTDHPINPDDPASATQSNLFTGKPLTPTNYGIVRAAQQSLVGADGQPLNIGSSLLVVPPQLEETGRQILNADFIPSAAGTATQSNVWKGSANLLVVKRLSNEPLAWYLMDDSQAIKPFMFQNREPPVFAALDQPTSEPVFKRRKFLYGVDYRGNAAGALWQLVARCEG